MQGTSSIIETLRPATTNSKLKNACANWKDGSTAYSVSLKVNYLATILTFNCEDKARGSCEYTCTVKSTQAIQLVGKDELGCSTSITDATEIHKFIEGVIETLKAKAEGDTLTTPCQLWPFLPKEPTLFEMDF